MPTLRLDADARAGVKALADLDAAAAKIDKTLEKTGMSARQLEAAALRIVKSNEGPLEKYNRQVAFTATLLEKEKLTREQAERAVAGYRRELESTWKSQAKNTVETDKNSEAMKRAGAALKQSLETPLEKHRRQLMEVGQMYRAGSIDQETFVRAARNLRVELDKSNPALKEEAERLKALADKQKEYAAAAERTAQKQKQLATDSQKAADSLKRQGEAMKQSLETPMERHKRQLLEIGKLYRSGAVDKETFIRQSRKLKTELDGTNVALEKTEKAGLGAFGTAMLANVSGMVTGVFSLGTAVALVVDNFQKVDATAKQAAESVLNSLGSIGDLQLISDDPKDFLKNIGRARDIVKRGITGETEAYGIAGALKVGGFSDDEVNTVLDRAQARQIRPDQIEDTIRSGKKVANLYAGQGLTFPQILDKLGVASGPGDSTSGEFATASTKWAQQNSMLGFGGDEGLAAQMIIEKQAGSIDMAGTQLGEFMNQVMKRGLGKGTIEETVKNLDLMVAGGKSTSELLGEGNAIKAYSSLSRDLQKMGGYQSDLAGATGFMDAKNYIDLDPDARAALFASEAAGNRTDAERPLARQQNLFNAVRDQAVSRMQRDGTAKQAAWEQQVAEKADYWNEERQYINSRFEMGNMPASLQKETGAYLMETAADGSERARIMRVLERIANGVENNGPPSSRQE